MLGWISLIICFFIPLALLILAIKSDNEEGVLSANILLFLTILAIICIMSASYQYHIVNIEYRYRQKLNVKNQLLEFVANSEPLVLKDMNIAVEVSKAIQALEEFKMEIESCKASPFSVFKPTFEFKD